MPTVTDAQVARSLLLHQRPSGSRVVARSHDALPQPPGVSGPGPPPRARVRPGTADREPRSEEREGPAPSSTWAHAATSRSLTRASGLRAFPRGDTIVAHKAAA